VIRRGSRKWQAERHVHRAAERRDLDRRHSDVVVGRDDGIELATHRPDEDGISRERAG
jgi:hypothetical protein